jgi:hypothetical protein
VVALAAALPLAGFIGLRPALAENTPPCGAVTTAPGCEKGGVLYGGIYQVPFELPGQTPNDVTVLCKGGPSAQKRDTALADNLFQLVIAQAEVSPTEEASPIVDSRGRLVGYSFSGSFVLAGPESQPLVLTCIDDH